MVYSTQGNNTACANLGPPSFGACTATAHVCTGLASDLTMALTPIIYTLFALGSIKVLDGVVKLTDMGVDTISYCVDRIAKKKFQREHSESDTDGLEPLLINESPKNAEIKPPPSRWKSFVVGWERVSTTAKTIGVAALCFMTAYPLLKITGAVNAGCSSMQGGCPQFKANVIDSCDWADHFVIDLIKQLIQGYHP